MSATTAAQGAYDCSANRYIIDHCSSTSYTDRLQLLREHMEVTRGPLQGAILYRGATAQGVK